ncbi:hypothetical protein AU652_24460 [Salmonella enterica subsp. enterica serovar Minnesota]|nr:hypothetical protein [Salmonella enterica subsp. enterica serovar Minnesota]
MKVNKNKYDHRKYFLDTFSDSAEMSSVDGIFCSLPVGGLGSKAHEGMKPGQKKLSVQIEDTRRSSDLWRLTITSTS